MASDKMSLVLKLYCVHLKYQVARNQGVPLLASFPNDRNATQLVLQVSQNKQLLFHYIQLCFDRGGCVDNRQRPGVKEPARINLQGKERLVLVVRER